MAGGPLSARPPRGDIRGRSAPEDRSPRPHTRLRPSRPRGARPRPRGPDRRPRRVHLRRRRRRRAWLLDPVWRKVDGDERYAFLGGQPLGEPLGGLLFGPNLLQKDPEAGVAPLRAYIRTVNAYFAGDYKADESFAKELAHLLDTDEEALLSTPSLRMDREIRAGTLDRLQDAYRAAGVHEGEKVPESEAVDRELYEEAVGHGLRASAATAMPWPCRAASPRAGVLSR